MRRTRELAQVYADRLGDLALDPLVANNIQRAAELTAFAEELRQRALRGEHVPADHLVPAERLADAAVKRLHLDRKPQPTGLLDQLAGTS
jgi:hypothetical protein